MMIHVSTAAARAPAASLRDGASATLAPTAPTSNAARTRGAGGSAGPSARLPSHGTGAERLRRMPSESLLFALVTGRFALGCQDPAQGPSVCVLSHVSADGTEWVHDVVTPGPWPPSWPQIAEHG